MGNDIVALTSSVTINGDGSIIAIGDETDNIVKVYSYDENNISWNQIGNNIDGEDTDDGLGSSVALNSNGSIVAIGGQCNDGNGENSGHVRVYRYDENNNVWNQIGNDIDGEAAGDKSGVVAINMDGSIVSIGAPLNNNNSGHVRVYRYDENNTVWNQIGYDIDGEAAGDESGSSVSLSSNGLIVAIGSLNNDNNSGHVRVFEYS